MKWQARIAAAALLAAAPAAAAPAHSPAAVAAGCDVPATPATFAGAVAQAAPGQTLCLATGDYGTWTGTAKPIAVTAAPGAVPVMQVHFGPGDTGFVLAGMSGMGGTVDGGAHDFTIRDSTFTSPIRIEATNANIVLDHNSHDWNAVYNNTDNAKIFVWNDGGKFSGVTIENSTIRNGNLDGVHLGGGAGVNIIGNVFANLCDTGTNHTDNIQFEGGHGGRIAANYVFEPENCDTQGITSYDGDTDGVTIEDNVVDIPRDWGIELYADHDSIVRHNTVVYHPRAYSTFGSATGHIDINRKPQDPAGSGTQVYDNLATSVDFNNGSTGTAHHNVSGERAVYVGPTDTYAGFKLAPTSPVGLGAASDGLDAGARIAVIVPPRVTGPVPPLAPGATAAPRSRLVASFGFGERSGRRVADGSGLGNAGVLHHVRRTRSGRHGRALSFDGHGYVSVPDAPALRLSRAVTLEAWVRPTAAGRSWRSVIAKQREGGPAYAMYSDNGRGRVAGRIRTTRPHDTPGGARLRLRRWSHLAVSYDGAVLRVYVNGRLKSSRKLKGPIHPGGGPVRIGAGFRGRIDDVRVWRVRLSAATIRRHARH